MSAKRSKLLLPMTIVLLALVALGAYMAFYYGGSVSARNTFRAETIAQLKNNADLTELDKKISAEGMVIKYPDGNWIAIRAGGDSIDPAWHLALAIDSKGRLYQTSNNFVGRFRDLRQIKMLLTNPVAATQPRIVEKSAQLSDLLALTDAKDLDAAREQLKSLGFEETVE